ncbi:MAG: DegT/DnrJ/EryC1/StrS aminotransferase, partial [Opitutae bacterium]|nr:DegT/DnrJ/EryC1/StrS aminotransferase [Opitutae bacterium]
FGDVEVFSMHATKVLNAGEGGFASTYDPALADRMRTIRNFHASQSFANVPLRINAKMSEAQAAMGLMSLEDLPANCRRNKLLYDAYFSRLSAMAGLETVTFDESESNNHQYLIVEVDPEAAGLSRDELVLLLKAENVLARRYFTPGVHRMPPYRDLYPQYADALPVSDALSKRLLQLPLGEGVRVEDVETVCAFLRFCLDNAGAIAPLMREKADRP